MFRTLSAELGYASWDACKRDIDRRPSQILDRFRLDLSAFGNSGFHDAGLNGQYSG